MNRLKPGIAQWARITFLLAREGLGLLILPLRILLFLPRAGGIKSENLRILAGGDSDSTPPPARPETANPISLDTPPTIFISAADPSGETHMLRLVEQLTNDGSTINWQGLGGNRLAAAGMDLLADLTSKPVMGFLPVLARIPFFCHTLARVLTHLKKNPPDLVILVDSPALNLILGREAQRLGIPTLYYICPQLWGWAPWRLKTFSRAASAALCIFPFEPPLFRAAGVPTGWSGHPVADTIAAVEEEILPPTAEDSLPILALLPGSRPADINSHLPLMLKAVGRLKAEGRRFRVIVAQDDPRRLSQVKDLLARIPEGHDIETTSEMRKLTRQARLTLVKSGTGSLETALLGAPNLVLYVISSSLLRRISRFLLTVPWFASANLIAGKQVVPELLLLKNESNRLYEEAKLHWDDEALLTVMRKDLAQVREKALKPGAATIAACWVKAMVGQAED